MHLSRICFGSLGCQRCKILVVHRQNKIKALKIAMRHLPRTEGGQRIATTRTGVLCPLIRCLADMPGRRPRTVGKNLKPGSLRTRPKHRFRRRGSADITKAHKEN